jgi:NitT/TauT family transport system permease protein
MGYSSRPRAEAAVRLPAGLLSVALFLALWQAGSWAAADPALFPSPLSVGRVILREAADGALFLHLGATLARVVAAFAIAMAVGTAIGLAMGMRRRLDAWADPWLVFFLNLPALVTIVLCYIWIGLTEAAAIAAVAINKVPLVTAMMREGARALDPGLAAMAEVFRMGRWARLRHVVLPQLAPHVAAAARSGLALIWKIVLVVEFLGRSNGVGFQIHLHFQLFDVTTVLAYAAAFILVMLAVEKGVLQPWERRAARWRAPA